MSSTVDRKSFHTIVVAGTMIFLILITVIILQVSNKPKGQAKDEIVASIDGETITKEELYKILLEINGQEALDMLIEDKILQLEVKKQNIVLTEEEMQAEIQEISKLYGGEAYFQSFLDMYGFTMEDVRADVESYLSKMKLLEPEISITEEEMKAYFEENKKLFETQEQISASHILLDTEESAIEVSERILAGEDFAEVAKLYSIDTATSEWGGALGYFPRGEMVAEFDAAAFSLQIGEISEPVKSELGYHIIKVEDKKEAKEAVYEENIARIRKDIFEQKLPDAYHTWLQHKHELYQIEYFING